MAQVPIEKASQPQLLWFAQVRLGMKRIQANTGHDKLIAKIREAWTEDFIETDDDMPADGKAGPEKNRGHYGAHPTPSRPKVDPLRFGVLDPLVNIRVHADRHKGGDRPVPCHLNGVEYWIPRNRDVPIPYRYYLVLKEAVGDIHDGWDDKAQRNSDSRETQSYTFTVNKMPSQAEIDAWHKMMEPYLDKQRRQKMARIRATRRLRDEDAHA